MKIISMECLAMGLIVLQKVGLCKNRRKSVGTPPTILSIKELDKSNTSIYPNPTSDFLNLNANSVLTLLKSET